MYMWQENIYQIRRSELEDIGDEIVDDVLERDYDVFSPEDCVENRGTSRWLIDNVGGNSFK